MDKPGKISHYRILREISRGGMGVVYEAVDEDLDRPVALKVTRAAKEFEGEALNAVRNRLRLEAQLLGRIRHPNLVSVYSFEQLEDAELFSMELVSGETLKDRMERTGPFPAAEAESLIGRVAGVMGVIHAEGIIHLDLKPGNIMLGSDGEPKVLDFGIAHVRGAMDQAPGAGRLAGTPNYMAPEQIRGEEVLPATDVFALGSILFELLAGERAFGDGSPNLVIQRVLNDTPDLLADEQSGREALGIYFDVIAASLSKDPLARPQDGHDFLRKLLADPKPEKAQPVFAHIDRAGEQPKTTLPEGSSPSTGPSNGSQRRTPILVAFTLFVVVSLLTVAVWGFQGGFAGFGWGRTSSGGGGGTGTSPFAAVVNPSDNSLSTGGLGYDNPGETVAGVSGGGPGGFQDERAVTQPPPVRRTRGLLYVRAPVPAGSVPLYTEPPGATIRVISGSGEVAAPQTDTWVRVPPGDTLVMVVWLPGYMADTIRMTSRTPVTRKLRPIQAPEGP